MEAINRLKESLIAKNALNEDDYIEIQKNIQKKLNNEFEKAVQDPYPSTEQLLNTVYFK